MAAKAYGRIVFWEGASLWVLQAPPGQQYPKTDPHAHYVVQVSLALTGRIAFDGDGEHVAGEAVAIAPNARHAFEGTGLVAHLFVAADGKPGQQLTRQLCSSQPIAPIPLALLGELPAQLQQTFEDPSHTDEDLRAQGRRLIAQLTSGGVRTEPPDPRIVRLLAWLAPRLDGAISLSDAARVMKLSPGRARHLFVQQTGLSFRTYLLWLRLMRAVELYAGSSSLTEAAHGAGFADSAHLSRTFRRMFGVTAASLRVT